VVAFELGAREPDADALATIRTGLADLPCPTVALASGSFEGPLLQLLDRFDVVVSSEEDLEPIVTATRRTPLAAMGLVQLLRHGTGLDAHQGLLAESLVYSTLQSGPEFRDWLARRPAVRAPRPNPEPAVLLERRAGCLELTLNRPQTRNAISVEVRDALVEGLRIAVEDRSIEEVVLRGAGPSFCAGGDLDEFGTFPDPATAHAIRSVRSPARLLADCGGRVCALLHGACVGAGIELSAFARRVVASEDAFFQLPEVAMGLVPGAGGSVSVTRRIGRQRAAYLALSGVRIDAHTAHCWGLVDEIAP
jgi:hypothetical protein